MLNNHIDIYYMIFQIHIKDCLFEDNLFAIYIFLIIDRLNHHIEFI